MILVNVQLYVLQMKWFYDYFLVVTLHIKEKKWLNDELHDT